MEHFTKLKYSSKLVIDPPGFTLRSNKTKDELKYAYRAGSIAVFGEDLSSKLLNNALDRVFQELSFTLELTGLLPITGKLWDARGEKVIALRPVGWLYLMVELMRIGFKNKADVNAYIIISPYEEETSKDLDMEELKF